MKIKEKVLNLSHLANNKNPFFLKVKEEIAIFAILTKCAYILCNISFIL